MNRSPRDATFVLFLLIGLGLIGGSQAAKAQGQKIGFKTPSNNIHCQLQRDAIGLSAFGRLRCDIRVIESKRPARPRWCDLDWGTSFEIADGATKGEYVCVGDAVADSGLPTLAYGATWSVPGFACTVEEIGLTCVNAHGRGFKISRREQTLF